jgi:hypothetical protein
MTFRKYPETVTLAKRPEILSVKQVVATEKLHGTNFRVYFPMGMTSLTDIRYGGRNEEFAAGTDGFYGGRPVRWFKDRPELLEKMVAAIGARGWSDVIVYVRRAAAVSRRACVTSRVTRSCSAPSTCASATTS